MPRIFWNGVPARSTNNSTQAHLHFYNRADWGAFTINIDTKLTDFNIDNYLDTNTAIKHSKLHIQTVAMKHFSPVFNRNIRHKIRTSNHLRRQLPTQDVTNRIETLINEISDDILHKQQTKWKQLFESITFNTKPFKLWRLIRTVKNT